MNMSSIRNPRNQLTPHLHQAKAVTPGAWMMLAATIHRWKQLKVGPPPLQPKAMNPLKLPMRAQSQTTRSAQSCKAPRSPQLQT